MWSRTSVTIHPTWKNLSLLSRMPGNHDFEKSRPMTAKKECPTGYHKRGEYTTSDGKYVPPRCVRATTVYKETSKEMKAREARKRTRRLKLHIPSVRSLSRKNCPPGMIPRKSYVRKYTTAVRKRGFTVRKKSGKTYRVYPKSKSTLVESKCMKDLGLPGKGSRSGKGIGPLRKGELKKHGYSFNLTEPQRHAALKSAVGEFGTLGVYRKLDAVAKLFMRTVPDAAKVFKADRDWVKKHFGPLKAF